MGEKKNAEYLVIELEDGENRKCEIMGIFAHADRRYIALKDPYCSDVYLYRYKETSGSSFELEYIEGKELEDVSSTFKENVDRAYKSSNTY